MKRPRVITRCVADQHADKSRERIIEFQAGDKGGLISFYRSDDASTLKVDVYRTDPGVRVHHTGQQYSDEAKAIIGANIARILRLRRDSEHRDRWQTTWGTKTAMGIFETVRRIGREIELNELTDELRVQGGRRG